MINRRPLEKLGKYRCHYVLFFSENFSVISSPIGIDFRVEHFRRKGRGKKEDYSQASFPPSLRSPDGMKTGKNFRIKVFGGIEVIPMLSPFRIKENHLYFFLRTDILYLFLCGLHI